VAAWIVSYRAATAFRGSVDNNHIHHNCLDNKLNLFDPKNNFEWRDYLRILRRRKWYFVIPLVLVLPLGVLKIVTTEPVYESSCVLQVESSRLLGSRFKSVLPGLNDLDRGVSMKKKILSTEYLNLLIQRLELNKGLAIRSKAMEKHSAYPDQTIDEIVEFLLLTKLRKNINIRDYGSGVIEIKATSTSPEQSYKIVQGLTEIFIEESLRSELGSVQSALEFNQQQILVYKSKLEEAERKLEAYEKSLISRKVENQDVTVENLKQIREAILAVEISAREKRDYLSDLSVGSKANDKIGDALNLKTVRKTFSEIETKIRQMALLMARYSSSNSEVIKANRSINEFRDQIKDEIAEVYKKAYPEADSPALMTFVEKAISQIDLNILERKKSAFEAALEEYRDNATQGPTNDLTLTKLQEEVSITRNIYNMFLQQNQGTQIEESVQRANASSRFQIIEPPIKPLDPISAGYKMVLLITMTLGTGLGGSSVYLREFLDKSLRTVQEAEDFLGVPVIGVLPLLGEEVAENSSKKKWLMLAAVFLLLAAGVGVFFYFQQASL
jgi:uncharacterized protein involved in exopolysaccharide biosynthesis